MKIKKHYYAHSYFLKSLLEQTLQCFKYNHHYMRIYRKYTNGIYQIPKFETAHFAEFENGRCCQLQDPQKITKSNTGMQAHFFPFLLMKITD